MGVLSAAVCTKSGKALVARQFVDVSRTRVEGLLTAFPKLITSDSQHTFIETEEVRYLYQPLEQLYMVIITGRNSNVVEDLDTLLLFSKIVSEFCRPLSEAEVNAHAFELVFAFDEVIQLGVRDKITMAQVKTFFEMDSHEEKIAEMVEKNKLREAKEVAKRRQTQIDRERQETAKLNAGRPTGYGGGGGGYGGQPSFSSSAAVQASSYTSAAAASQPIEHTPAPAAAPGKGMQLKKAPKNDALVKQLEAEGVVQAARPPTLSAGGAPQTQAGPAQPPAPAAPSEPVSVIVEEKLTILLGRDGTVENIDVKGELTLAISQPELCKLSLRLAPIDQKTYKCSTHPNINKQTFTADSSLVLKDPSKGFPPNMPLGLLKWRFTSKEDDALPLKVSCWVSPSAKQTTVNIEFELLNQSLSLREMKVLLPIPGTVAPKLEGSEGAQYSAKSRQLLWTVPVVDAQSSSGNLEFSLPGGADPASFFPVAVTFASNTTICPIEVLQAVPVAGGPPPKFALRKQLTVESYEIRAD
jgi:hypothetical protein